MAIEFTVGAVIPTSPQTLYETWLDSDGHSRMTGSPAHVSAVVGETFDAWDGYISGRNLELDPGRRILQSWRGADYAASAEDSRVEIILEPAAGGTRVTLHHSNIPDGHTTHEAGWGTHYFEPMKKHFAQQ